MTTVPTSTAANDDDDDVICYACKLEKSIVNKNDISPLDLFRLIM